MVKRIFLILFLVASGIQSYSQNIAGIGAQLIVDSSGGHTMPRIFSLVPNSPAYQFLRATDYIVKVNGVACLDKNLEQIVGMIRGEAGTKVIVTTSHSKDGKDAHNDTLTRVSMSVPGADPVAAFYEACENEVKKLQKDGAEIVQTFNSECGNYFFNFNATPGSYQVQFFTMEEKSSGPYNPTFHGTAKVYDGDNEANTVELGNPKSYDKGNSGVNVLEGVIIFKKECVGVISTTIKDDGKKCKGMYIIVYRSPQQ